MRRYNVTFCGTKYHIHVHEMRHFISKNSSPTDNRKEMKNVPWRSRRSCFISMETSLISQQGLSVRSLLLSSQDLQHRWRWSRSSWLHCWHCSFPPCLLFCFCTAVQWLSYNLDNSSTPPPGQRCEMRARERTSESYVNAVSMSALEVFGFVIVVCSLGSKMT